MTDPNEHPTPAPVAKSPYVLTVCRNIDNELRRTNRKRFDLCKPLGLSKNAIARRFAPGQPMEFHLSELEVTAEFIGCDLENLVRP